MLGEEALQGQLVHADRRGEHVGADVGDVEHSSSPWTLPSSPKAPCRAGKTASAPSSPPPGDQLHRGAVAAPAPVAADRHRRPSRARPPRSPRATEAPERSETSCSEERPPERTATLMALLLRRRRWRPLADDDRHRVARFELGARRRELVDRAADLARRFGFFFFDRRLEAGGADRFHRFGAQLADHVRHLGLLPAGGDDDRDGRAHVRPGCRRWATGRSPRPPASCFLLRRRWASGRGRGSAARRGGAGCRPAPAPWPASGRGRRTG